jgi:hypothetical protein
MVGVGGVVAGVRGVSTAGEGGVGGVVEQQVEGRAGGEGQEQVQQLRVGMVVVLLLCLLLQGGAMVVRGCLPQQGILRVSSTCDGDVGVSFSAGWCAIF